MLSVLPLTRIAAFLVWLVPISISLPRDASGQSRVESKSWFENLEIGAWLGPNVTWFAGEDASNEAFETSRRAGFAAAVEVLFSFRPWFSGVTGLGFATRGAKYEFRTGRRSEFRSSYVLLPLLIQVAPIRLGRFEPYVLAGPEVGLMASCELRDESSVGDCKDTSNLIDPGLVVGGGVAIATPWSGRVRLEVRYEQGLISIDDMEVTRIDSDYKNRAVLFSIGYSHRLRGADRH
jgi:Outer membrane protein beta-barrel domain